MPSPEAIKAWRSLHPRFQTARADDASRDLLPLLAANLERCGLRDPVTEQLTAVRERIASSNRILFDAGRRLLLALREAGIETMLLKGGALAEAFYRDPSLRSMGDLDVLVPTAQAQRALDVLRGAGWAPKTAITPGFIRAQHATDIVTGDGSVRCDLHWHVYWECCQPDADEELWAASVSLDFAGVPTRMLGPADQLLHLCVHGSRRARRPTLRWIPDAFYVLRTGGIDWSRLLAQAERRRFVLRAGTMLAYLRDAFTAPVPGQALARLEAMPVSRLERVEYHVGNRRQGLLGELPSYWCNYRRQRDGSRMFSPLGFPRYLQHTWKVASLGQVVHGALVRARRRARMVIFGPSAPE